jgi:8-oxo-dGTP pyrophosphatase MutT (NUDIX family)
MTAEFLKDDYRAFIFAIHPLHGILLLHCTRKKNKGPHYQAPGGHIDKEDFDDAMSAITPGGSSNDPAILMQACKIGAARELYEETGMDVRSELDRYGNAVFLNVFRDVLW